MNEARDGRTVWLRLAPSALAGEGHCCAGRIPGSTPVEGGHGNNSTKQVYPYATASLLQGYTEMSSGITHGRRRGAYFTSVISRSVLRGVPSLTVSKSLRRTTGGGSSGRLSLLPHLDGLHQTNCIYGVCVLDLLSPNVRFLHLVQHCTNSSVGERSGQRVYRCIYWPWAKRLYALNEGGRQ